MAQKTAPDIAKLRDLVRRLRAPDGCPWDREQTLGDLRAYLLEEAHEAAAAIDSGSSGELREELGDLLFQVVFIARLAEEAGDFDLAGVIDTVHAKMIERHPHVFGDAGPEADAASVRRSWERRKLAREPSSRSLLDGVPGSLPTLTAAYRITQKAAGVGFDWPDVGAVLDKVREELAEVEHELTGRRGESEQLREELGDLLFAVANLARHLEVDPEAALARGNLKFRRRFAAVEQAFRDRGRPLAEATLDEMDEVWEQVKTREHLDRGEIVHGIIRKP